MRTTTESNDDYDIPELTMPTVAARKIGSKYQTWEEARAEAGIIDSDLPVPTLWRCVVFPKTAKKFSEGGIALPDSAIEAEGTLNYIGQVISVGTLAGRNDSYKNPDHKLIYPQGMMAGVPVEEGTKFTGFDIRSGDWVLYGKFSGMKMTIKGVQLLIMNDDEFLAKIDKPDFYEVYL